MTKEQIIQEVSKSSWQPKFEFTDNLDAAVDSILKPHEDYFLGLHDKVKEIIEREIGVANSEELIDFGNGVYQITFADISNWQKQLFEHKKFKISQLVTLKQYGDIDDIIAARKTESLPNQHINLGLRQTNVKVGNWTPPAPMFLEELKEICLPIKYNHYGAAKNSIDYFAQTYLVPRGVSRPYSKNPNSKAVVQLTMNNEYVAEFNCIKSAAESGNFSNACIGLACKGKIQWSGGCELPLG